MMIIPEYPFIIRELTSDDGSGFLIEFPDLPGCILFALEFSARR
jgi:predicted RNase H-like HicB family nuclease